MQAIYEFSFYCLDQSIMVGEEGDFAFDTNLSDESSLYFKNSVGSENTQIHPYKIDAISHPELGDIYSIATENLDYTITLENGEQILVNAEEQPGHIHKGPKNITSWKFSVETSSVLPLSLTAIEHEVASLYELEEVSFDIFKEKIDKATISVKDGKIRYGRDGDLWYSLIACQYNSSYYVCKGLISNNRKIQRRQNIQQKRLKQKIKKLNYASDKKAVLEHFANNRVRIKASPKRTRISIEPQCHFQHVYLKFGELIKENRESSLLDTAVRKFVSGISKEGSMESEFTLNDMNFEE